MLAWSASVTGHFLLDTTPQPVSLCIHFMPLLDRRIPPVRAPRIIFVYEHQAQLLQIPVKRAHQSAKNIVYMKISLLLEMSLLPLYEGQRLWKDILDRLEREGFVLWQIPPGLSDPTSGQSLRFDEVFYRKQTLSGF